MAPLVTVLPAQPATARPAAKTPAKNTAKTPAGQPQTGLRRVALTIATARTTLHYQVEIAATADQQAIGMMFRRTVPTGTGMLFPTDPPRPVSFWMHNTLVPLDLLFIGVDGRIRNIVEQAVPLSETPLESLGAVAAVLELAGGEAERAGIRPGDKVNW